MRESMLTGVTIDRPDLLVGVDEIMQLVGDDRVTELEQQFLTDGQRKKKKSVA
jgi:hypothetical protein